MEAVSNVVPISAEQDEWITWDTFWTLWPRKVARKEAQKAWDRLTPAEQQAAILALPDWRRVWSAKDMQYVPHASTWLHGERWDDELPPEFQRVRQRQSETAEFNRKQDEATANRAPMPEALRALLAQMKRNQQKAEGEGE